MATILELQHFAILDIGYTHNPATLEIQTITNNPCHLTCYYTSIEPVRHKTTRIVRGLLAPWGAYWCFVAWNSVEQEEAGDTLAHTFIMPVWSYCQTKWFTFRGTVAGILSPSNTPIFKHHHSGIELFCNLSFEDYPVTPAVPPCWYPTSLGVGTAAYERDPINVQHGLYSCKITATGMDFVAWLYQRQWSTPYYGKTVKFTFNWFGSGRFTMSIWYWTMSGFYGPGWHTRSKTFTFGYWPILLTLKIGSGGIGSAFTQLSWDNIKIEIL